MKKKKFYFKISDFISNIRFREKMLLIYIIGGIIPFVVAILYLNQKNSAALLEQCKKAQEEGTSFICTEIRDSMTVAEEVAGQLYENEQVKTIAAKVSKKEYKDAEKFEEDCKGLDFIDEYEQYYQSDISSVTIYVRNKTIASNKYFSYVGGDMRKLDWYLPTRYRNGNTFWSYIYDDSGTKKIMQLTRLLKEDDGTEIGVLAIQLQADKISGKIGDRSNKTMLFYGEKDILTANFQVDSDYKFIFQALSKYKKEKGTKMLLNGIKEYLVSYERIDSGQKNNYYTLVSIVDYQELQASVYAGAFSAVIIMLCGLLLAVILIVFFSERNNIRLDMLREQMRYVASGQYDKMEPIEGKDEVALLYQELEKMKTDIQNLTFQTIEENVQREKLHTHQKEVEFKMLASQINPHFLYNTLETIRMKAKINKEPEIEELVKMLAKIMRRNIQVGDQMVTLQSEIELLENYFVIQNYRFGDRIQTEVQVEEDVDTNIMVIPLIMQPFAENAFVHGLESKDTDGKLLVHISKKDSKIVIEINDNGAGISYYKLAKIRRSLRERKTADNEHIGIRNVHQRLVILYGSEAGVTMESSVGKGTRVTICFPFTTQ